MNHDKKQGTLSELEIIELYKQKIIKVAYRDHKQLKQYMREVLALPYATKPDYARSVTYIYQMYLNVVLLECDYGHLLGSVKLYFELAAPIHDTNAVIYYQYVGALSCWLGILFNNAEFYQKSIFYCDLALNELLIQNVHTDIEYARIAWCYQHLGKNYIELRNYQEAIRCTESALLWQSLRKDGAGSAFPYLARAYIKASQQQYKEAIYDLRYVEQRGGMTANMLIDFYILHGNIALDYEQIPRLALDYYTKALALAEQHNFQQNMPTIFLAMVRCYEQLGNKEQALGCYQRYADITTLHTKSLQLGYANFIGQMFSQVSFSIAVGAKKVPTSFESFWAHKIEYQERNSDKHGAMSIVHCIVSNLSLEQLDAAWLAKELYMSERSLHRKIVQFFNMPPKKLIQTIRLQTAKTMLETRSIDVATTSIEVGFNSPTYFSKAFKRMYNISPYDIQQTTH